MKKLLLVSTSVLFIVGFLVPPVSADDTLVRFKGGIGVSVTPPNATTVTPNVVRSVNPPGQIWRIGDLEAKVKTNGDIEVEGKGLVLAGGGNIGRATGQHVFATLICEAAPPFTLRNTNNITGVPLAPNGDFKIDDVLQPIPPADCTSPVLLIRNVIGGNWFAAGILQTGNDDD